MLVASGLKLLGVDTLHLGLLMLALVLVAFSLWGVLAYYGLRDARPLPAGHHRR